MHIARWSPGRLSGARIAGSSSTWPAREGVGAAQSAVNGIGLTIDVGGIIAGDHGRDLVWLTVATQRVELADLALAAAGARHIEDRLGHARLDEARTDSVDAHPPCRRARWPRS